MLFEKVLKASIVGDHIRIYHWLRQRAQRLQGRREFLVREGLSWGHKCRQVMLNQLRQTSSLALGQALRLLYHLSIQAQRQFGVHDFSVYVQTLKRCTSSLSSRWPRIAVLLMSILVVSSAIAQSLPSLTDSLLLHNPQLQSLEYAAQAFAKTGEAARQLPDLELGAGLGVLPVETRLGPQRLRVGATQMLPWPGVLDARQALADARVGPVQEQAAAQALELRYQLATAYYQLAAIETRVATLREADEVYDVLDATALARIEAGRGSSVDVYRTALQRERLDERIAVLLAGRAGPQARINALLDQAPGTSVAVTPLAELIGDTVSLPPQQVLAEAVPADHPLLRIYAREQSIAEATAALSDLDARPDLAVGLDYILTNGRDDAEPSGNGRDAVIPRVGVRVPLSRKPYTARREAEAIRVLQLADERTATRNRLLAEASAAYARIDEARARLRSLARQEKIIDATLRVATGDYAEGQRAFDEVIRLEEQIIELRLRRVDAQAGILMARAELIKILAL